MFVEDVKTKSPKVEFEYNVNPKDLVTRCSCGKLVSYDYGVCPVCGKTIVKPNPLLPAEPKEEVGILPVEPLEPTEPVKEDEVEEPKVKKAKK